MKELFTSPVFWGALLAFLGTALAALSAIRKDSASIAMQVAQEARTDVREMRTQIKEMRGELDAMNKSLMILKEKYSAALTDAATSRIAVASARSRLAQDGIKTADLPPVPELIEADMRHSWPEVFDGL